MTEYGFCGLVFFGAIAISIIVTVILDLHYNNKNKKREESLKKQYNRMKDAESAALFEAIVFAYDSSTEKVN